MFLSAGFDLSDPQSLNSYAYARNNPLRYNDPDGKWFMDVITGKQSWNSFVVEVGDAANYMYSNSGTWQTAMDHPYATGAVVGVAGGAAAVAGAAAAPTAVSYLTSSQALTGAGVNVASQALQDATSGKFSGVGSYAYSAVTGAVGGGSKGGVVAQGLIAGGYNYGQQKFIEGKKDVDWGSVAISAGSAATASKVMGSQSLKGLTPANRSLGQTILQGTTETAFQVMNVGVRRSMEQKQSYPSNFIGPIPLGAKKGK